MGHWFVEVGMFGVVKEGIRPSGREYLKLYIRYWEVILYIAINELRVCI